MTGTFLKFSLWDSWVGWSEHFKVLIKMYPNVQEDKSYCASSSPSGCCHSFCEWHLGWAVKKYVTCPNRAKHINNIILNLVYDSFLPINMLVLLLNTKKFSVYLKKMRDHIKEEQKSKDVKVLQHASQKQPLQILDANFKHAKI